jgi:hypothetical protein
MERYKHMKPAVLIATITWQLTLNLNEGGKRHTLDGEVMDLQKMTAKLVDKPEFTLESQQLCRTRAACAFWFDSFELVCSIMEANGYHEFLSEKQSPGLCSYGLRSPLYHMCIVLHLGGAIHHRPKGETEAAEPGGGISEEDQKLGSPRRCFYATHRAADSSRLGISRWKTHERKEEFLRSLSYLLEGLAHERCAAHAQRIGDRNEARYHFGRALLLYREREAFEKVDHLEPLVSGLMEEVSERLSSPRSLRPLVSPGGTNKPLPPQL